VKKERVTFVLRSDISPLDRYLETLPPRQRTGLIREALIYYMAMRGMPNTHISTGHFIGSSQLQATPSEHTTDSFSAEGSNLSQPELESLNEPSHEDIKPSDIKPSYVGRAGKLLEDNWD
jgi:hypothetical protein